MKLVPGFVLATDRGGHLHNALGLLDQLDRCPAALVTTHGPDIRVLSDSQRYRGMQVVSLPHQFTWVKTRRFWNPVKLAFHIFKSFFTAYKLKPKVVISLGASNMVLFCYFSKFLGAQIFHVECMSHVFTESLTAKWLYPICTELYVQWEDLLPRFGAKARYMGCVL